MAIKALDVVKRNRSLIQEASSIMQKLTKDNQMNIKESTKETPEEQEVSKTSSLMQLTSMEVTRALPAYMLEEIKEKRERTTLSVADDRAKFFQAWAQVINEFIKNPEEDKFECPVDLSGFDRKELHRLAQKYNLGHHSTGQYPDRRLVLTKDKFFYQSNRNRDNTSDILELIRKPEPSLHRSRRPVTDYMPFDADDAREALAEHDRANNIKSVESRDVLTRLARFQKSANPNAEAVQCARVASSNMISVPEEIEDEDDPAVWEEQNSGETTTNIALLGTKWSNVLDPHIEKLEKPDTLEKGMQMYPYNFGPIGEETHTNTTENPAVEPINTEASHDIVQGCGRKRKRSTNK